MASGVKVSVLVPIYNVEKYLSQCMDSLCAQTLGELEIICINDGSTDRSGEIVHEYAKKDPRIRVIDKTNSGYGASMNVGLAAAHGEYIGIVESDDYAEADMMESLYRIADKNNLDIIKSNCFFYSTKNDDSVNEKIDVFEELPLNTIFEGMEQPTLFWKLQTIWSALYKRSFLLENGIRFQETPGASYQDVSFVFQAYACAKRIMLIPQAYLHYRIDNMASSVNTPTKVFCICDEIDYITAFIEKQKENNKKKFIYASRLAYRVLKENFENLGAAFQYALFLRMVDYLRTYEERGYITDEIWEEECRRDVERMLENPNSYFLQKAKSFADNRIHAYTVNQEVYGNAVLNQLISCESLAIYGAGIIGRELLTYLLEKGAKKENISFLVSSREGNPEKVEGIPVLALSELEELPIYDIVAIAVREQLQYEIADRLKNLGCKRIISIDAAVREMEKNANGEKHSE